MEPGDEVRITVVALVNSAAQPGNYTNTAAVLTSSAEQVTDNNTAQAPANVVNQPTALPACADRRAWRHRRPGRCPARRLKRRSRRRRPRRRFRRRSRLPARPPACRPRPFRVGEQRRAKRAPLRCSRTRVRILECRGCCWRSRAGCWPAAACFSCGAWNRTRSPGRPADPPRASARCATPVPCLAPALGPGSRCALPARRRSRRGRDRSWVGGLGTHRTRGRRQPPARAAAPEQRTNGGRALRRRGHGRPARRPGASVPQHAALVEQAARDSDPLHAGCGRAGHRDGGRDGPDPDSDARRAGRTRPERR